MIIFKVYFVLNRNRVKIEKLKFKIEKLDDEALSPFRAGGQKKCQPPPIKLKFKIEKFDDDPLSPFRAGGQKKCQTLPAANYLVEAKIENVKFKIEDYKIL